MSRVVALLSGGMDSTTLVAWLLQGGHEVHPLGVHYGQRHAKELDAARAICAYYGLDYRVADLSALRPLLGGSALTDDAIDVPLGHYADPSMALTVVPNRNAIMLSVAAGYAASIGAINVYTAVHAGDHPIYPDCRPRFISALNHATILATEGVARAPACGVGIRAPFAARTKTDIASIGTDLAAPLHLSWSCYLGGDLHCGRCGTCVERREAFHDARVADPTLYAGQGAL